MRACTRLPSPRQAAMDEPFFQYLQPMVLTGGYDLFKHFQTPLTAHFNIIWAMGHAPLNLTISWLLILSWHRLTPAKPDICSFSGPLITKLILSETM